MGTEDSVTYFVLWDNLCNCFKTLKHSTNKPTIIIITIIIFASV